MILELLKLRTRPHHERAEASLPLMDPALTLDVYRETLISFLGFYAPMEAQIGALSEWNGPAFDVAERRKTGLLERDLRSLGLTAGEIALVPRCRTLPDTRTLPRTLGALYVMEGATLGGQTIRRHVERTLGQEAPTALAFFSSYGDRVGPMWKEFQAFVTRRVTTRDDAEAMVDAAAETFDALTDWITRAAVPSER